MGAAAHGRGDLSQRLDYPARDELGALSRALDGTAAVMAQDRDEARAAHLQLAYRSTHDHLTGLPNRELLFDRIDRALLAAARRPSSIALVFLDLDRFKQINDTLGHAAGDSVLREVARRWSTTLRDGDTLARLAGDEFVLLCERLPCAAGELDRSIQAVQERLQAVLVAPVRVAGVDLAVSASIGVALDRDALDAEDLMHAADTAMYAAKQRDRAMP